jgi:thioredoxin reductase (NADPH)
MDIENDGEAEKYIASANLSRSDMPLVVLRDGTLMVDPSLSDLAAHIGLQHTATQKMYDVLIIGAGPAGLAASVYGSCEGLKTLLIERSNPGGQASTSARIENYLGFPTGLSGAELTQRAMAQTLRFGTEFLTAREVKNIRVQDGYKILAMSDGSEVHGKTVIIATGVDYRKLDVPGTDDFTGAGVYYGAASVEAYACKGGSVYIVGGGNSACQAALHISKFARDVTVLIRRDALKEIAANYLVENICKTTNIKVLPHTEIVNFDGEKELERITLMNCNTGERDVVPAKAVFVYIGQRPGTAWLNDIVLKDEHGFILTGRELMKEKTFSSFWKLEREPFVPETSVPGIFASGDVRFTALTGISSAVGEGAMAIRFVRKYLSET